MTVKITHGAFTQYYRITIYIPLKNPNKYVHPGSAEAVLRRDAGITSNAKFNKLFRKKAGFLVTSRISYEMVEKAAAFGAGALVAISVSTSLGIERARHHGMMPVGIARPDAMTVFSVPKSALSKQPIEN